MTDTVTVSRELLRQVLNAACSPYCAQDLGQLMPALRAALEQPQDEPGGVCARCGGWVCDPVIEQAPVQEPYKDVLHFLTDVVTAAGLLEHGRQCKALAKRISNGAFALTPRFTETVYTDPDTGASVIIHKEPQ